jgi:hypothetical protein
MDFDHLQQTWLPHELLAKEHGSILYCLPSMSIHKSIIHLYLTKENTPSSTIRRLADINISAGGAVGLKNV